MGQKTHPKGLRLGIIQPWQSRWFTKRDFRHFLKADILLRSWLKDKLEKAEIEKIEIERSPKQVAIIIHTARPGFLIGRGGGGIEELRKAIVAKLTELLGEAPGEVRVEVQEVGKKESSAVIIAQQVAGDLERRQPFGRVIRRHLDKIMSNKDVRGAKIEIAGRLGGAEMSRREWVSQGRIPLHTLRANIDYGEATAYTTAGTIGVKVWIYKGEIFKGID